MFIISLLIPAGNYLNMVFDSSLENFLNEFYLFNLETLQEQFTYVIFWGLATMATLSVMLYYGKEIVDSPKLVHRKDKFE